MATSTAGWINKDVCRSKINAVIEARIAELLLPFLDGEGLKNEGLQMVGTYLDLLVKWNNKVNLTAIRNPEEMITRHFGEALFAARHLLARGETQVEAADLGSGAGFPGLPLKIWAPRLRLTLVESNHRKATFLREVIRALGLTDAQVLNERAERLTAKFDLITVRAIERFARMLPVATRLLKPKGRIGLLTSSSQLEGLRGDNQTSWKQPIPVPLSRERVLVIGNLRA